MAGIQKLDGGMIIFRIYGITNPSTLAGNFALINLRLRKLLANNELQTIYEEEYNLFLNLKSPDSSLIVTYDSTDFVSFLPISYVQEEDKTLEHYIKPHGLATLSEDSYYITVLPKEVKLKDKNTLSICPANFECWTFKEENIIIYHTTASVGVPFRADIPNVDTPEYAGHDNLIITSSV